MSRAAGAALPPGSALWSIGQFTASLAGWRRDPSTWIAFLLASLVVATLVHVLDLPGGVIPALPILVMWAVPHSWRLFGLRILLVVAGTAGSYVLSATFQETPWVLLPLAAILTFVGLYLVARGQDLLTYMCIGSLPVVAAWEAGVGTAMSELLWNWTRDLLLSLAVVELMAILIARPRTERDLRRAIAERFRDVAALLSRPIEEDPDPTGRWSTERVVAIEGLLARLRAEQGRSVACRNLHALADILQVAVGWDDVRRSLRTLPHPKGLFVALTDVATPLRAAFGAQFGEVADAVEARRPARWLTDLDPLVASLGRRSEELLAGLGESGRREGAELAVVFPVLYRLAARYLRLAVEATGEREVEPTSDFPLPRLEDHPNRDLPSTFGELLRRPDRWAMIFAAKGCLVVTSAFVIGSVFWWWGGALVFLLMSSLLTGLTIGAITAGFLGRLVGLVASLVACLVAILVFLPNAQDPWFYAAVLGAAMLPGAIAITTPSTAGIGLSYAMSVFFVLTSSDVLSVDLSPIEQRFVSVCAGTVLPWAVFLIVRPVYARERITGGLSQVLASMADLVAVARDSAPRSSAEQERRRDREIGARIAVLSQAATIDRLLAEAVIERHDPGLAEMVRRFRAVLDATTVILRFICRLRSLPTPSLAGAPIESEIAQAVDSIAQALRMMATSAAGSSRADSDEAIAEASRRLEEASRSRATGAEPPDWHVVVAVGATLRLLVPRVAELQSLLTERLTELRMVRSLRIGGDPRPA